MSVINYVTKHELKVKVDHLFSEKGLFPNIFNLATHSEIRATSTCGQHGPDYYCKLVGLILS